MTSMLESPRPVAQDQRVNAFADSAPIGDKPEQLLQQAVRFYGERVCLATSLGPQSLVLIDMMNRLQIGIPIVLLDTGLLFAETRRLKREVEERFGIRIRSMRARQTLIEQAKSEGAELWRHNSDRCCYLRKVVPMTRALAGRDAWVTGLRRDQGTTRESLQTVEWDHQFGLVKINPLAFWSQQRVQQYLRENRVPYNPLLDQGYRSIGCWPCTSKSTSNERSGRWAGSNKTECGLHNRLRLVEEPDPKEQ